MKNVIQFNQSKAFNDEDILNSPGTANSYGIKYSRKIYQSELNQVFIGVAAKRNKLFYNELHQGINLETSYFIFSDFDYNSLGFLAYNSFYGNLKEISFFMDIELSAYLQKESEIGGLIREFGFGGPPVSELQDDIILNGLVAYFSIRPGAERNFSNFFTLFLSTGWSQSITPIFDGKSVDPNVRMINDLHLNIFELNLGFRF